METGAEFSDCGRYRYALWRIWDRTRPMVLFIGLNPSTADEAKDDQTIRRCIGLARGWGYGGIHMGNLFAFRATNPGVMKAADEPVGADNDRWLVKMSRKCELVVAAWGDKGRHLGRNRAVKLLIPDLHCVKINATGEPGHPLFVMGDVIPVRLGAG